MEAGNAWLEAHLGKDEQARLSQLIAELEAKTSGEIVTVIARRSESYSYVRVIVFLSLLSIGLFLEGIFLPKDWFSYGSLILVLGSFLLALFLTSWQWSLGLLIPQFLKEKAAHQRAELEFYRNKIGATKDSTGILLFVSILERKAIILADESIHRVYGNSAWDEALKELLAHLGKGQWFLAFDTCLRRVGKLLAEAFPAKPQDANELPNTLIILNE